MMMPLSTLAPHIARRVGMRAMFVGGALLLATGLALMAVMASTDGYLSVLPGPDRDGRRRRPAHDPGHHGHHRLAAGRGAGRGLGAERHRA